MHIRDKILLWIALPILWALLFYIIPKPEDVIVNGILSLIFLVVFIGLIVNIFVQIHKIDRSAKKDIKVKKQIEKGAEI